MANFSKSFNFRNGVQVDNDKFIVKPTTGLVGIGSTVPTQVLDVVGNIKSTGTLDSNNVEVGTGITVGINSTIKLDGGTGRVTAIEYIGDGSTLTNVVAIATAGFTELSGTLSTTHSVGIGSTQPLKFKLDVIGATRIVGPSTFVGVTTVSDLFADALGVSGVSKFTGGAIVERGATINQANVTGVSTFAGDINANGNIVGDDSTNISGISSVTASLLQGTTLNATGNSTFNNVSIDGSITSGLTVNGDVSLSGVATFTNLEDILIQPPVTTRGFKVRRNDGSDIFQVLPNLTPAQILINGRGLILDADVTKGLTVAGVSTFSGLTDVNNRLDVVGGANIDQLNITGVSTLTGRLTATEINSAAGSQVKLLQGGTQVLNTIGAGVSVYNKLTVGSLNGGTSGLSTHTGELGYGVESGLNSYATRRSLNLVNKDYGNINFYLNINNLTDDLTNTGAIDRTGNFIWHKGTGTQLMTLTGIGGSLGIGVTNPDSRLHVAGDVKFGSDVSVLSNLTVANNLTITSGTLNSNVTGNLVGNVNSTGVSTFSGGIEFSGDTTINATAKIDKLALNSAGAGMGTLQPPFNTGSLQDDQIFRALTSGRDNFITAQGFIGIRTDTKFSNVILNGANANAVFGAFGVGDYEHFQSNHLQAGAVDFANAGVTTQRYMVPPKVDNTARDALVNKPSGAFIYNTSLNKLQFWNGSAWETVTSS